MKKVVGVLMLMTAAMFFVSCEKEEVTTVESQETASEYDYNDFGNKGVIDITSVKIIVGNNDDTTFIGNVTGDTMSVEMSEFITGNTGKFCFGCLVFVGPGRPAGELDSAPRPIANTGTGIITFVLTDSNNKQYTVYFQENITDQDMSAKIASFIIFYLGFPPA